MPNSGLSVGDPVAIEVTRPLFFDAGQTRGGLTARRDEEFMDEAERKRLIEAMARTVITHAEELTELDRQIGDGDHGLNMKRGFEAVLETLPPRPSRCPKL